MCHLLLGLPFLALPVFWLLPLPLATAVYGVTVAVSLIVYVYAWKTMRMPRLNGTDGMLGASGRVVRVDERGATLFLRGELWSAEAQGEKLALGDEAIIVGFEGLRLRARKRRDEP